MAMRMPPKTSASSSTISSGMAVEMRLTWHASNNTCRNKLCAEYEEEVFKDLPFKLVPVDIEKRKKGREKEKEDENSRA